MARSPDSSPLPNFHQLPNFSLHQIPLQRADVADVKFAVQVIGFMQESPRQLFLPSLLVPLSIYVLRADGDLVSACDWLTEFGNA